MASSARGLRVLKTINIYTKGQPDYFDPYNIFSKIKILSLSNGVMKAIFTVDKTMCNGAGAMHGGFITSVFDTTATFAQLSLPDSRLALTTNLNVNFFKSSTIGKSVTVETAALKTGQNPVMEAIMKDESGSLIAKSVISYSKANEELQLFLKQILKFDVYEN